MKKVLSVILVAVLVILAIPLAAFPVGAETVSAGLANAVYTGRWVQENGTLVGNFNAGLEVRFTGTSIKVVLAQQSGFVYQIDGGDWRDSNNVTGTRTLASGLSAGTHTLKLAVRHHASKVYLNSFVVDNGATLSSPGEKTTIEFIGDSITAGYIDTAGTDNIVSNTYAFRAAEALNLYHDSVAVGGTSIVASQDSSGFGNMASIYTRVSKEKTAAAWDTSAYIPDYIVVNLGTNDTNTTAAFCTEFTTAYVAFLTQLRGYYPDTAIVAMVPFNGNRYKEISDAVSQMNDANIYYLDTANWTTIGETTDGIHLSKAAHITCGNYLAQALSNLLTRGTLQNADGTAVGPTPLADRLYSDFTTLPTAENNTTAWFFAESNASHSLSNGALNMTLKSNGYVRLQKKESGLHGYRYLVLRAKGDVSGLTSGSNAFQIWMGSYGTPSQSRLNVKASQITSEYSDIVLELPTNFFDYVTQAYIGTIFFQSAVSSSVSFAVDKITFTNDPSAVEPEPEQPTDEPVEGRVYYSNFTNDFSSGAVPSGYGENTVSLVNNDGTTYSVSNGVLHLVIPQNKYLRLSNTMTDMDQYRYMVIRMKGSHNYPSLDGNALKFWFGSYGTPGANLYMSVDDLTAEYSDVVIEIPTGYFDGIAAAYKGNLFITSERGATFTVDIDEIYFTDTLPGDTPVSFEQGDVNQDGEINILDLIRLKKIVAGIADATDTADVGGNGVLNGTDLAVLQVYLLTGEFGEDDSQVPSEPEYNKYIYNDFESGLGTTYAGSTPTGNGNYVSYAVSAEGGIQYAVEDGVLSMKLINGSWLRTWSNITGLQNYKYMVLRMKGTCSEPNLTGNALSFKFGSAGSQSAVLAMSVDQLTPDYSYVFVEIPNHANFYSGITATDYRYSLWIGSARGVTFDVDIDEIFFTNDEPV